MGVDAEDFDRDCDVDLFMTHLAAETNTLYVNEEGGWFTDRSNASGLGASSGPFTGFGTGWFDADNDGDLDIFSANGAVTDLADQVAAGVEFPLRQVNQLWLNDGTGKYTEVGGGPAFELSDVSRGTAFGDLDNDGDIDLLVTNNNGRARLYRNDSRSANWLGVSVLDGRRATGARVRLASRPCGDHRAASDGSYASANDVRVVFGLSNSTTAEAVEVVWRDGTNEVFGPLEINRYHRLERGAGRGAER
jgi:hypothetical protein